MAPHDLADVRRVLTSLLEGVAEQRKRDDIAKRLEELYSKLGAGGIKNNASQKVMQMVKAIEAQDFASAQKMQLELFTMDWDQNKNWLQGVKRLMPTGR